MGNSYTTKWRSPMEDDQDEREVQEWLKWKTTAPASRNGRVQKLFPGLDVLAVQPVYLAENTDNSKKKYTRWYNHNHNHNHNQKMTKGLPLSRSHSLDQDILDYSGEGQVSELSDTDEHKTKQNNNSISVNDLEHGGFRPEIDEQSFCDLCDLDEKQCKFPTGELNVSLSYDPISNRMKVFIVKAKNLSCGEKLDKPGVTCSESFIRITLVAENKLQQVNNTSPKKNGHVDILFYENFSFYLRKNLLKTSILEIKAMHRCKNILKSSHVVGRVLIGGTNFNGMTETKQWYDAIANPRQVITKWHTFWC